MTDQELMELLKTDIIKGLKILDERAIKKGFEIWKILKEYPNYKISSHGRVKNIITDKLLNQHKSGHGYLGVSLNQNGSRKSLVHRLVCMAFIDNPNDKLFVDHKNNIRDDNNVTNLRWCTAQENNFNSQLCKLNKSGIKGVTWHKRDKRWTAQIKINDKKIHLGNFINKEDAIKARQTKANELFKEFTNKCEK